MQARSAIVLVTDRWGAGFCGPYGHTWLETPTLNRLASESLLLEFMLADAPELATQYRSYWQGGHAWSSSSEEAESGLPGLLHQQGIETVLVTDEESLTLHPLAAGFSRIVSVPCPTVEHAAVNVVETQLARLFSAALDELQNLQEPCLLWVHAQAMQGPWDAPREYRLRLVEDEDPDPPPFVIPPRLRFTKEDDPDILLGYQQAYAGQVMLTDLCLGAFLEEVQSHPHFANALTIWTSPRGFPLGEHGSIGEAATSLHGESLHIPCLIRHPEGTLACERRAELVQAAGLNATLRDWFRVPPAGIGWGSSLLGDLANAVGTDRAAAVWQGERALRTPQWFLRVPVDGEPELYAKPDDRWEVNEVASRARPVVEQLLETLANFEDAARHNDAARLTSIE